MKPTPRLIRRRLAQAYGALLSFNGIPMIVSGGLILTLAFSAAIKLGHERGAFAAAFVTVMGIAYCIPWGVFTGPVDAEEEPFL